MASRISSTDDPDPPWKTKSTVFTGTLYFSEINS